MNKKYGYSVSISLYMLLSYEGKKMFCETAFILKNLIFIFIVGPGTRWAAGVQLSVVKTGVACLWWHVQQYTGLASCAPSRPPRSCRETTERNRKIIIIYIYIYIYIHIYTYIYIYIHIWYIKKRHLNKWSLPRFIFLLRPWPKEPSWSHSAFTSAGISLPSHESFHLFLSDCLRLRLRSARSASPFARAVAKLNFSWYETASPSSVSLSSFFLSMPGRLITLVRPPPTTGHHVWGGWWGLFPFLWKSNKIKWYWDIPTW